MNIAGMRAGWDRITVYLPVILMAFMWVLASATFDETDSGSEELREDEQ